MVMSIVVEFGTVTADARSGTYAPLVVSRKSPP